MDDKKDKFERKDNFMVFKEVYLVKSVNNNDDIKIASFYSNDSENYESKLNLSKIFLGIFIGQLLSIISVLNGFFNTKIQIKKKLIIPFLLTSIYYLLFFICFIIYNKFSFKKPKLIYILIILIDCLANGINIYVFSLTKFEYPYIINLNSTLWSVIFTIILIKNVHYCKNHIFGLIIGFIGNILSFLGTFQSLKDIINIFEKNNLSGLIFCIIISILYAIDQVLQEKYLETNEIFDYFIWCGIIGFFISFIITIINGEIKIIFDDKNFELETFIYLILSVLTLTLFSFISPFYIIKYSANMFSMNLISTVFWAFLVNFFLIQSPTYYYYMIIFFIIGLLFIILGTLIFNSKERITNIIDK